MNREDLKKFVLVNLRGVTQSSKGGVPLQQLQSEYSELLGTKIPVEDLGYNSLESFLRDVPDVICLKKNKEGSLIAQGIADASTAHIASLVSKQKKSKKSKSKPSKPPVSAPKQSSSIKSTSSQNMKYAHTSFGNVSPNIYGRKHGQYSEVSPRKSDTLRSSIENKVPWKRFERCSNQKRVRTVNGYVLDPIFSTSSNHQFQDYVNTKPSIHYQVPDYQDVSRNKKLVQLSPDQQKFKKSVMTNLNDLIKCYKGEVSLNELQKDYRSFFGTTIPFRNLGYNSLEDFLQGIPDVIIFKKKTNGQPFVVAISDSVRAQIVNPASQQNSSEAIEPLESVDYSKPYSENTDFVRVSFQKKTELPSFFKSLQRGTGVTEQKKTEGMFNASSIELSNSLHDGEQLEEKQSSPCSSTEDLMEKETVEKINDRIQRDLGFLLRYLKSIVQTFSDGIAVNSLQVAYKNVFGSNIPFTNFGYSSVEEFIRSVPNDLYLEKNEDGRLILKSVVEVDEECIKDDQLKKMKDDESPTLNYPGTVQTTAYSKSSSASTIVPGVPLSTTFTLPTFSSQQENTPIDLGTPKYQMTGSTFNAKHPNNSEIFQKKETENEERGYFTSSTILDSNIDFQILNKLLVQPQIRVHSGVCTISADKDEAQECSDSSSSENESTMQPSQSESLLTLTSKTSQNLRNDPESITEVRSETEENMSELEDGNDAHKGVHPLATDRGLCNIVCMKPFKSTSERTTLNFQDDRKTVYLGGIKKDFSSTSTLDGTNSLKENSAVSDNITKANLGTLLHLHFLLFGVSGMDTLKEEILSFTNLSICKDSEEWKKKESIVSQLPSEVLRQCLTILCIHYEAEDDENTLICKLMEFFEAHAKIPAADERKKVQEVVEKE